LEIDRVELSDFRNYRRLSLTPSPQLNILAGLNAQGKTNLLEGLGVLLVGRSFRGAKAVEMLAWGAPTAYVTGDIRRGETVRAIRRSIAQREDGRWGVGGGGCAWTRAIGFGWPDLAILTDSPDFHLRVARRLFLRGIPVVYLVAPQVWAWRKGRIRTIRRNIRRLLCIFPFEEQFFAHERVSASYIGHPLTGIVRPSLTRDEFFRKHRLASSRPLVSVLPGSRRGEAARHLPALLDAAERLYREKAVNLVLPASATTGVGFFRERMGRSPIKVIEGESWDAMAHADLALAASGTVTVEAAILGTPMVTFYKVTRPSWVAGKLLVDVPFYSMVNLIAGRALVPELMQEQMTGERLAAEAQRLLSDEGARREMQAGLAEIRSRLADPAGVPPARRAAEIVQEILEGETVHVSLPS